MRRKPKGSKLFKDLNKEQWDSVDALRVGVFNEHEEEGQRKQTWQCSNTW